MRKRVKFYAASGILGATILAISAWQASKSLSSNAASAAAAVQSQTIVIASAAIRRGDKLALDALTTLESPAAAPNGSFYAVPQAVGRVALSDMPKGELIGTFNTTHDPSDLGLAPLIPVGMRATSILVSDQIAVGTLIQAGDRIDVLLVAAGKQRRTADADLYPDGEAKLILENVSVLAVGSSLVGAPGESKPYRHITLAVTPKAAAILALAESVGSFYLSLRSGEDREATGEIRVTSEELKQMQEGEGAVPQPTDEEAPPQTTVEMISGQTRKTVAVPRDRSSELRP